MRQEISVRHPGSGVGAVKLVPTPLIGIENVSMNNCVKSPVENVNGENIDNVSTVAESSTPSSGVSISQLSTDTILAAGSTKLADSVTTSLSSLRSLPSTPRHTITTDFSEKPVKPPNIIIFSDSSSSAESVKAVLETTLQKDRYTFHVLVCAEIQSPYWFHQASLVVVHGNLSLEYTQVIIDYILVKGGSILCLCSDLLRYILPVFRTAEVRPNEFVHCSYKSWKHVPLIHHVFCYQPAPPAPHFSHDEHNNSLSVIPASVNLKDKEGKVHEFKVEVLGVEETWQTPSLLLLSSSQTSAKIIFSQVHLEIEPRQYEISEKNVAALQESNKARLEILCDVLSTHLGLICSNDTSNVTYTPAYFLGNHEIKHQLLQKLTEEGYLDGNMCLKSGDITLKFCGKGVTPSVATSSQLPVLMHACPETFSTVEYFENLKTEHIGRLVLYCQTVTSSMSLVQGPSYLHGFTVIPQYQTKGVGRGGNTWLSPEGCAMFTVQLHISLDTYLGQHLSLLQHVCSLAVVAAICQLPGLEELDIGLKWPNDIYANKSSKIGGVTITSSLNNDVAICNVGCGLNLNNKEPTVCINDMIRALNVVTKGKIPVLTFEKYYSSVFNKLEDLYKMTLDDIEEVYSLYYNYWLHTDAEIQVKNHDGTSKHVKVKAIDPYGFLIVQTIEGKDIVVHPDGNSFDMMSGLILPKVVN
ncbi:hypothetical protein AAG570_011510 [Ranatra chinensis]|uniref:BPL/LPL catalytic domain-containing protein n=1 Tax=Ranatra chinensis TaxID=642074 RepID=A0ABD0YMZ6_9HEMI